MNTRSLVRVRSLADAKKNEIVLRWFFSTSSQQNKKDASTKVVEEKKKLLHVPKLPFVGSILPFSLGSPKFNRSDIYTHFRQCREKFGEFYSIGVPGIGKGVNGLVYATNDPDAMMKVIRSESKGRTYPRGGVQLLWPVKYMLEKTGDSLYNYDEKTNKKDYGLFDNSARWKTLRTFLQTDMLNPKSAKGFVPAIVVAAEYASNAADLITEGNNLDNYFNICAFDMFNSFMFGEFSKCADPRTSGKSASEENRLYCSHVTEATSLLSRVTMSPYEILMHKIGIETRDLSTFVEHSSKIRNIAFEKIERFMQNKAEGKLNGYEEASYLSLAIDRQKAEQTITVEEMKSLCNMALSAAVDTTSTTVKWNIIHLALNQEVQRKLYDELHMNLESSNKQRLDADVISKSVSPYLHHIIRESHRLTPVLALMVKTNSQGIDIHGENMEKGSVLRLDRYAIGINPKIVDKPYEFIPERWIPDAVKERSGSEKEVLDHILLKEPFGQGQRRCPGSRVATNETLVMIAQLVLDWEISIQPDSGVKSLKDIEYNLELTIVPKMPGMKFKRRKKFYE